MDLPSLPDVGRRLRTAIILAVRRRRVWARGGRAHIEVRGAPRVGHDELRGALERAFEHVEGVDWVAWNAALGQAVIAFDGDNVEVGSLLDVVESLEHALGVDREPFEEQERSFLDESASATRLMTELAVDGVALTASVWGSLARLTPIPIEWAAAVQFLEAQIPVREAIAHRIGNPATDVMFAVTNAFAQGLAQGPLSLVNDMAYRADLLTAVVARDRMLTRTSPHVTSTRERATAYHTGVGARPAPRPRPRADVFVQRSGLASAAAGGALLMTGSRRIAGGAFVAGIGKAAMTGRAAYAAELERTFARRNIFLLDASVIRRFEQVDAVVVDARTCDPSTAQCAERLASSAGLRVVDVDEETNVLPVIRDLQRVGRVVATVSDDDAALHAADVSVAVHRPDRVAWHADVVTPATELPLVMTALAAARPNADRALALSVAGSGVAALLALSGVRNGARAAATAVNIASLVAMGIGTWDGRRVGAVRPDHSGNDDVHWHALDATRVLAELGSSLSGLDPKEAHGRPHNSVDTDDPDVVDLVAAELATPLTPVLSGGAGVSAFLGSVVDALLVAGVLVGNVTLGVAQRISTQRAVRSLEAQTETPVRVVRAGVEMEIPFEDLVAGDVIRLTTGDVVPADARVLTEDDVLVDESGLTGEPFAVGKRTAADTEDAYVAERHAMLYSGTTVVSGSVQAVVVAVGEETEAARATRVGGDSIRQTGVERRLAEIARVTVPLSLGAGAVLTASSLLRGRPLRETVATGVGLVAAVLPEGLPIVATTAQLGAARRLSQHNAIVRTPRTIEALGRVDVLCFDKTGTLTEGAVRVRRVATRARIERLEELDDEGRDLLQVAVQASVVNGDNGDGSEGNANGFVHVHSADRALQSAADQLHLDRGSWTVAAELPFEHDRSYAAMRVIDGENVAITVKGAPEVVLPRCTTWRARPPVKLDDSARVRAERQVEELASTGYRVLAIAQRGATSRPELADDDVQDLELVGFIGFADAVRDTARDAVRAIEKAGVDVVMITGDHPLTAESVAQELGALDGRRVLAGPELDAMNDDELDAHVDDIAVYARVTPAHKARIVQALQRRNHVVAMTGDGTNDAAAIRLADVGVALGGQATAAARHAADVVVTDDRLETIVAALIEGRAMWGSVRDALSILLGGNLGELGYAVAIGLATGRSPLNARQTLLVNLLTDLLPAAAIAGRPPRNTSPEALLASGPDVALGNALTEDVITRAIATSSGASAAWLTARFSGRRARANTIGLVALVETQLGQTLLTGGRSPLVVASTVGSTAALAAIVQTPGVSQFFGCTPLGPVGWTIATSAAVGGTAASLVLPWATRTIRGGPSGEPGLHDLAKEELEHEERQLREDHGEQFLHDDLRR